MNPELPDVQAGFRKGRGTGCQIANIRWIIEKAREFQKNIYFCFIDYAKAFDCVDHNKLWKVLNEMEIPDHLTCFLRNLYAGQEATVRTGHGTGSKLGKEYIKAKKQRCPFGQRSISSRLMLFPVVMQGCESWTIKKAERQRVDAFELWCWRRLLRIPWTARRSNKSILKEINPEHSLEGLILKLQHFGHLMQRGNSLERPWCWRKLKAEGEGNIRGWDGWMVSPNQWTWVWPNSGRYWRTGKPGMLQSMGLQKVVQDLMTEEEQKVIIILIVDSVMHVVMQ